MKRPILVLSALALATVAGVGITALPTAYASQPEKAAAAPGVFSVDTTHSSLIYKIKHQDVAYFYGRFNDVNGAFKLDPASPESGSVDMTVKADSVDTGNKKRDDHLRSQDFFSAKEFEKITFKSTSVKKSGENTFDVTGDFTMHGVTKQITVPVEFTGAATGRRGQIAGIHTTFTIKRSDYGMDFMQGKGLGDEVTITASLEGGAAG
jgi:polyisoprenoid-binding protein YceI